MYLDLEVGYFLDKSYTNEFSNEAALLEFSKKWEKNNEKQTEQIFEISKFQTISHLFTSICYNAWPLFKCNKKGKISI